MQYSGELLTFCCLNVSPNADHELIQQGDIDVPRVCLHLCNVREWKLHRRFLFCFCALPYWYNEGRRCNDKPILQQFDRRHPCMKTVNCVACS